jgi:endopolyphosphatase
MKHTFLRGGYYTTEVVPSRLYLISLNSLYFFEKNAAVDACGNEEDPGSEELLWLELQFELIREQGGKVWVTGHVPPEKGNWYPDCLDRYSELVIRYREIVLGCAPIPSHSLKLRES